MEANSLQLRRGNKYETLKNRVDKCALMSCTGSIKGLTMLVLVSGTAVISRVTC